MMLAGRVPRSAISRRERKSQCEDRAVARSGARGLDRSIVEFNEVSNDRKAESET